MQTGDEAQAVLLLQGLVEAYPDLLSPWLNLGILRLRTGQLESADAALQQALRLDLGEPGGTASTGYRAASPRAL